MEIKQQKHSNKIRFAFGEDALDYSIEDGSGSRSFSVPYADISRDRQTLVERNAWLRNVGLLWLLLGAALTVASFTGDESPKLSFWIWLGAACYGVAHYRTTRFTIVPTDKGNLCVIDDGDGQRILAEIESRRAQHFRSEFDFMPEGDSPEQLRSRFKWLHKEGVLSDEELGERMAKVNALEPTLPGPGVIPHGARLN